MRLSVICVVLSLVVGSAFAAEGPIKHEIGGGTSMNLFIPTTTGSDISFVMSGFYNHAFTGMYQLGTDVTFATGGGNSILQAVVGPTFNFGAHLHDAFFVSTQAGLQYAKFGEASSTDFMYQGTVGKRFELANAIAWRPNVQVVGTTADGDRPTIVVQPIAFSLFF